MSAMFDLLLSPVSSLIRAIASSTGDLRTRLRITQSSSIMADDMEEEFKRINVVVKTSKSKETIETEPTATILEVFFYFNKEKFTWSLLK